MDAATVKCTAESVLGFLANLISNRISGLPANAMNTLQLKYAVKKN